MPSLNTVFNFWLRFSNILIPTFTNHLLPQTCLVLYTWQTTQHTVFIWWSLKSHEAGRARTDPICGKQLTQVGWLDLNHTDFWLFFPGLSSKTRILDSIISQPLFFKWLNSFVLNYLSFRAEHFLILSPKSAGTYRCPLGSQIASYQEGQCHLWREGLTTSDH